MRTYQSVLFWISPLVQFRILFPGDNINLTVRHCTLQIFWFIRMIHKTQERFTPQYFCPKLVLRFSYWACDWPKYQEGVVESFSVLVMFLIIQARLSCFFKLPKDSPQITSGIGFECNRKAHYKQKKTIPSFQNPRKGGKYIIYYTIHPQPQEDSWT